MTDWGAVAALGIAIVGTQIAGVIVGTLIAETITAILPPEPEAPHD